MSSLLGKYQRSRKLGYNPRNSEPKYPSLSDLNNPISTSKSDKYSIQTTDKDLSSIRDRGTSKLPLRSWDNYKKDTTVPSKYTTSESFSSKYPESRFRELNNNKYHRKVEEEDFKSRYSSSYLNRLSKYGIDRVDNLSNPTDRYYSKRDTSLGSPIKSLNSPITANGRNNRSLYKVLGTTPLKSSRDYRINKISKKKKNIESSPGIISRLYSYFTKPGENDVNILKNSARNVLHIDPVPEKRVAFNDRTDSIRTRRQFEIDSEKDAVDDAIRRSKEWERNIENERLKTLERKYNRLEEELKHEITNKERIIKESDNLKLRYEQEKSQLQEIIESLKDEIRTKENQEKDKEVQLENIEHENYRLELALQDLQKELEIQTERNKTIRTEMELREKLKSSRLENDSPLNPLFKESAQIDKRIRGLEEEYNVKYSDISNLNSPLNNQIERVEKKIDVALENLSEHTESFGSDKILEPYDAFYVDSTKYLDNNKSKLWKLVETRRDVSSRNYKEMFTNLHCLKKLNTLSYKLVKLKELLNDCKILEEYKTSGLDLPTIYKNFIQETL